MKFLTNVHRSNCTAVMREMGKWHDGKWLLGIGNPEESGAIAVDPMLGALMIGIYEIAPCQCKLCIEDRRCAALEAWRRMNEQTIAEKEE